MSDLISKDFPITIKSSDSSPFQKTYTIQRDFLLALNNILILQNELREEETGTPYSISQWTFLAAKSKKDNDVNSPLFHFSYSSFAGGSGEGMTIEECFNKASSKKSEIGYLFLSIILNISEYSIICEAPSEEYMRKLNPRKKK